MPSSLKPKNYFNLTYSVIPDNKIKQVVGNYTETVYEDVDTFESSRINEYILKYKDGHTARGSLPLISYSVKNKYRDVFYEDVTYDSTGYYAHIVRTEKVAVRYTVTIENEKPMHFENVSDAVSITSVEGTTYTVTGSNLPWDDEHWCYFDDDPDVLWAPFCYNDASGPAQSKSQSSLSNVEIKEVTVDPVYDGQIIVSGKYQLVLYVTVYVINNTLDAQQSITGVTANYNMSLVSAFKISVNYYTASTRDVDFDYHLQDADYKDYSLTVKGNEYTNANTTYSSNVSWAAWVSGSILNKYHNGKIFINAKIKLSYLIENEIDIDSELYVKDINNDYLARVVNDELEYCVFRVKNIEYVCDDTGYNANVVLLEERTEQPAIRVAFDSCVCVLDLSGIDIQGITIHPIEPKVFVSIENDFEIIASNNAIVDIDHTFVFDSDMNTQAIDNISVQYTGKLAVIEGSILPEVIDNTSFQLELDFKGVNPTMESLVINNVGASGEIADGLYSFVNPNVHYKVTTSFDASYILAHKLSASTAQTVNAKPTKLLVGLEQPIFGMSSHNTVDTQLDYGVIYYNNELNIMPLDTLDFNYTGDVAYLDIDNRLEANVISNTSIAPDPIQLGFKASMSIALYVDRPIDDTHFFNLSISQWIDLSIEDMLEIVYND